MAYAHVDDVDEYTKSIQTWQTESLAGCSPVRAEAAVWGEEERPEESGQTLEGQKSVWLNVI